ncbi:hypothetical protein [Microbaculum marinisediminis]|uniref:Uncharacterized protein n=1 Tax=Microbaculum marinisediminis TaxID=2931392 RepID=A0AAW5R192_9HYPH|nr:hypothetical protein [Microbaculum sp. A6E488]MCT8972899.1 hypothetical protein [Microbaculum sp. A6E488]
MKYIANQFPRGFSLVSVLSVRSERNGPAAHAAVDFRGAAVFDTYEGQADVGPLIDRIMGGQAC